ncbi:MAG: serine/threonine protein kinase [Cyanobacteria bacterium]|nr:serine/threonine protein kinase [Cyanobacteriota bacterium]MDW8202711.1 serine/threonine-protein kinase [Cyanobacteriota bacterium SKYGB_h_bin112]
MAEASTDHNIGRLLDDRYRIDELIGKGSMGKVYLAHDVLLGEVPVAVKFLAKTLLNQKMRDRFKSEARTCAQLGQKTLHVVRVMDYGVDEDEVPFYVMEYLRGESLADIVRSKQLTLSRFVTLTRQICLGLQCAHQELIIHRDIKPRNILVIQDASIGEMAKVLDFGIARIMQSGGNETTSFMGTLAYASPEQMEGKELDIRSDIYSMGVMMYEMLTNRLPLRTDSHTFGSWYKAHHFQPPTALSAVLPPNLKVPSALEQMIMACLAKSPDERPQSIAEVIKVLEPLESRYDSAKQVGQKLEQTLATLPAVTKPSPQQKLTADEICQFMSWPKDKPVADIVFPHMVPTSRDNLATLWAMMSAEEVESRRNSSRYNQFLCLMSPHPMLLWVTVIYNPITGPRWLPCYLDLKTSFGRDMTRLLGERGYYRLLLFSKENPQRCAALIACTIAPTQCSQLKEWLISSQSQPSIGQPTVSKNMLKQELEKLKPKILLKLEALGDRNGVDLLE